MGSKNKPKGHPDRQAAPGPPRQEVDRLIAKGWLKDAVKAAKICQRDHPSPEHHRLLERATLLRAQELLAGGMVTAAREVATHLLDLKVTDPDLIEPVVALLAAVGLAGEALKLQGRLESPEALDRLARQAADQAVLHPERAAGATPEVVAGARQVRAALEALTAGDEATALDTLRGVARSSPFADWRLFARGLAASRRGDAAEAQANWDRLDPARAAARIVAALRDLAGPGSAATPAGLARRDKLERWAFGEPLIAPLRAVAQLAAQGRWGDLVRQVGLVRLTLRRADPALAVRLTQALIDPLCREAMELGYRDGQDLLRRFTKAVEPLPIDPHWHRLWALVWEGPQGDVVEADPFWRKYLDGIDAVPAIRPEDRKLATALVMTHLGLAYAEAIFNDEDEDGPPGRPVSPEVARDRHRAMTLFEGSLERLPTHRPTYQALMDLHEDAGQADRVVEVARRLLAVLPDDFDALMLLVDHHFGRDEPDVAYEFAARARRIKPLDRGVIAQEWACLVSRARQHALARRWDDGRADLDAAARLDPIESGRPHFDARRVALEIKAGRADLAGSLLADALGRRDEAASLWLGLAIEARRFKLPRPEVERAEARWAAEAAKKVRADAAGAVAELLGSFLAGNIQYSGRQTHIRQVADYLRRATRIKFERRDLAQVCGFLGMMRQEPELYAKLAKRGLKLFPVAPEFPLMLGMIELEKGQFGPNVRLARQHLQKAVELATAEEATNPKAATIIAQIRPVLEDLDRLARDPFGFSFASPGRFGGAPRTPAEMLGAMAEMMGTGHDPEDLFGDDDGDDPEPAPRPKPKRRS